MIDAHLILDWAFETVDDWYTMADLIDDREQLVQIMKHYDAVGVLNLGENKGITIVGINEGTNAVILTVEDHKYCKALRDQINYAIWALERDRSIPERSVICSQLEYNLNMVVILAMDGQRFME